MWVNRGSQTSTCAAYTERFRCTAGEFYPKLAQVGKAEPSPLEVNGIGNIVIISHEVCGGDDLGEVGEAKGLDIIAAGSRVRPSSSHGRYDQ